MLIFVDCEAFGPAPALGQLTEFGAVEFKSRKTFHGVIVRSEPSKENPAIPHPLEDYDSVRAAAVMSQFSIWLSTFGKGRHIFVSDNPAYDYQWVNYEFAVAGMANPFGHSARRIADFYAGLMGDFYQTQNWKKYRKTPHDHNPVNDAMGNVEAFAALLAGKR
jgi:hypothetical protein